MKKIILVAWLTLYVAGASAQDSKFGIKGGMNLSNLYTKDVKNTSFRIGYHGGIFVKLAISNHLAIQPEVMYSTKGASLEYENAAITGRANFDLNYIDIPVLAVFNLTHMFSFHFGPYFSMITDATLHNENDGQNSFDFESALDKKDFSFADYGVAAGVGMEFQHMGIGFRYNHGLQNVGKKWTVQDHTFRFPDATNALFQLYVAVNLVRL